MTNVIALSEYKKKSRCIDVFREKLTIDNTFFSSPDFLDFVSKNWLKANEIKLLTAQEIESKIGDLNFSEVNELLKKAFTTQFEELTFKNKWFYEWFDIKTKDFDPRTDLMLYVIELYKKSLDWNTSGEIIIFPLMKEINGLVDEILPPLRKSI